MNLSLVLIALGVSAFVIVRRLGPAEARLGPAIGNAPAFNTQDLREGMQMTIANLRDGLAILGYLWTIVGLAVLATPAG